MENTFKSSVFGGFNRDDVIRYIEKTSLESKQQIEALEQESDGLCRENAELRDKLAAADHLLFICGHYEGIDERVYALADHVISLGDYVLTSGELASMVVIDAAVRKLPGVLGAADGPVDESFTSGLLEYPQYTRPADFRGMRVPEVLTSGNHAAIARWRREQSLARTAAARPDLIVAAEEAGRITPADQKFLKLLEPAPTGAAEGVS